MAIKKIDSNATGLRFAEEVESKVLPGAPIWYPLEPNSYKDFGGQLSTVARNPINASRQRKKGTITDLDASGGFSQDLTQNNTTRLMQGIFFAKAREKGTTGSLHAAGVVITGVSATQVTAAAGMDRFKVGDLVLLSGFGVAGNNGLKMVTAAAAGAIDCAGLTEEAAPPAGAKVEVVGFQFDAGDLSIAMVGGLPRLTSAGGQDMTTLGLIPGEWVYLGGDGAGTRFTNNSGFARVNAVAAGYVEFDKTDWTPQVEAGGALTIRLFLGIVLKNESDPALIQRFTYQLERYLGKDDDGDMAEYLPGAVANEWTIDMKQADKITTDISFVATDNEQRTGLDGLKGGTRPNVASGECFNTTSDFARIKLAKVNAADAAPVPLFAFATEMQLSVKNNVTPNKAIGTLGAFDVSAGTFEVGGKLTAYFSDVNAVKAVRENADVTIDIAIAKNNAGMVFDIPLIALGDGRLSIEQDKAVVLPLEMNAAESKFNHTLLVNVFPYLPTIAG